MYAQRIERLRAKQKYYYDTYGKDHPQKELMDGEIHKYTEMIATGDTGGVGMGSNRMVNRAEKLVHAIRKAREFLKSNPASAVRKRTEARIEEYQTSIKNIQEFGQEKAPNGLPDGVTIEVPHDVMTGG